MVSSRQGFTSLVIQSLIYRGVARIFQRGVGEGGSQRLLTRLSCRPPRITPRILSRHHCPRDPMRLPSACATSVPFRARYQFSRGFSLRGENDYIWKFLGGFFVLKASKLSRESIKRHVFVRRTRHGGIIQCNNPASKR